MFKNFQEPNEWKEWKEQQEQMERKKELLQRYKIRENNLLNSIKSISEIASNLQKKDPWYISLLKSLYTCQQKILYQVMPPSDEQTKIDFDESFTHYLINGEKDYFKSRIKLQSLLEETSFTIMLQCKEALTEEKLEKVREQFLFQMEQGSKNLFNQLTSRNLGNNIQNSQTFMEISQKLIKLYTGTHSNYINSILASKDPVILSSMNYFLNILMKSYQPENNEKAYKSQEKINKKYKVKQIIFDSQKENHFLYFTHLTSTSKKDLKKFWPQINDEKGEIWGQFYFTLLNPSTNLFSALTLDQDSSQYPKEQEVLLLPYSIFQIKSVNIGYNKCEIELQEIDEKFIINKIKTPLPPEEMREKGRLIKMIF